MAIEPLDGEGSTPADSRISSTGMTLATRCSTRRVSSQLMNSADQGVEFDALAGELACRVAARAEEVDLVGCRPVVDQRRSRGSTGTSRVSAIQERSPAASNLDDVAPAQSEVDHVGHLALDRGGDADAGGVEVVGDEPGDVVLVDEPASSSRAASTEKPCDESSARS